MNQELNENILDSAFPKINFEKLSAALISQLKMKLLQEDRRRRMIAENPKLKGNPPFLGVPEKDAQS